MLHAMHKEKVARDRGGRYSEPVSFFGWVAMGVTVNNLFYQLLISEQMRYGVYFLCSKRASFESIQSRD